MTTSRTPTLAEVIRRAIEKRVERIHVAIPGIIETYDAATQTADVRIAVNRLEELDDGTEVEEEFPIIPDVPVAFPRAGDFYVSFPLKKGNSVLLIFCERSIDNWLAGDGGVVDPDVFQTHDLVDAVAYPGIYPETKALKNNEDAGITMGHDSGCRIVVEKSEVRIGADATEFASHASKVLSELNAIVTVFNAHTHPANGTPPPMPQRMLPPSSVAASKTKVE